MSGSRAGHCYQARLFDARNVAVQGADTRSTDPALASTVTTVFISPTRTAAVAEVAPSPPRWESNQAPLSASTMPRTDPAGTEAENYLMLLLSPDDSTKAGSIDRPSLGTRVSETMRTWLRALYTSLQGGEQPASRRSSTDPSLPLADLYPSMRELVRDARERIHDENVEYSFRDEIDHLVGQHRDAALEAIARLVLGGGVDAHVAASVLRSLGQGHNLPSVSYRRWILEGALKDASAAVRDGASVGLSALGDPRSMPALRDAIAREPITPLRRNMEKALQELEKPRSWR